MPKYDIYLKDIIRKVPAVFMREVLGIDAAEDSQPLSLDIKIPVYRKPDLVFPVKNILVHVELQTHNDQDMHLRMLEYFVLLRKYTRGNYSDILQFVVYIGEDSLNMKNKVEGRNINYCFSILDMKALSCDRLLQEPSDEAFLLATLCNIDARKFIEHLAERFKHKNIEDFVEFEQKLLTLLSLRQKLYENIKRLSPEVKQMPIPIRETMIFKEGKEEGIKEAVKVLQVATLEVIRTRFGNTPVSIKEKIKSVQDIKQLRKLLKYTLKAKDMQQIEKFIDKLNKEKTDG